MTLHDLIRGADMGTRRTFLTGMARSLLGVTAVPGEHFGEQRRFDLVQHERVDAFARLRLDVGKITAHGARNAFAQRRLQLRFMRGFGAQDADGIHGTMAPWILERP